MANLIITVISIALVAVAALMGAYYGGALYRSYVAQTRANTIINETKQVFLANTKYMLDNQLTSFNDFKDDQPALAGITNGRVPILNQVAIAGNGLYPLNATSPSSQLAPYQLDNKQGLARRANCQIGNVNKVLYLFFINDPYNGNAYTGNGDFSLADNINHPIVQMCLKINAKANLPAGLTYAASGLPHALGNPGTCASTAMNYYDGSGDGYCYIQGLPGNNSRIFLQFSN